MYIVLLSSILCLSTVTVMKRIDIKGIFTFFAKNEKEIIQIMLAVVLISYMIAYRFLS